MYCETCPVRDYCMAYESAREDNDTSYHRQGVVRVDDYDEPPSCPLLKIVKKQAKKEGL